MLGIAYIFLVQTCYRYKSEFVLQILFRIPGEELTHQRITPFFCISRRDLPSTEVCLKCIFQLVFWNLKKGQEKGEKNYSTITMVRRVGYGGVGWLLSSRCLTLPIPRLGKSEITWKRSTQTIPRFIYVSKQTTIFWILWRPRLQKKWSFFCTLWFLPNLRYNWWKSIL